MKMPLFYALLGLFCIIIGIALSVVIFLKSGQDEQWAIAIAALIAMAVGLLLFAKGYIAKIIVTEEGLVETTLTGKEKIILWDEIEQVSFGIISQELKIRGANKKIKVHVHTIGFPMLTELLVTRTGMSKADMGIPA